MQRLHLYSFDLGILPVLPVPRSISILLTFFLTLPFSSSRGQLVYLKMSLFLVPADTRLGTEQARLGPDAFVLTEPDRAFISRARKLAFLLSSSIREVRKEGLESFPSVGRGPLWVLHPVASRDSSFQPISCVPNVRQERQGRTDRGGQRQRDEEAGGKTEADDGRRGDREIQRHTRRDTENGRRRRRAGRSQTSPNSVSE